MKERNDRNGGQKERGTDGKEKGRSRRNLAGLAKAERDGRAAREEEVLPKASLDCRVPLELPREVEPAALQQTTDAGRGSQNVVGYRCPMDRGQGKGGCMPRGIEKGVCEYGAVRRPDGALGLYGTWCWVRVGRENGQSGWGGWPTALVACSRLVAEGQGGKTR